MSELLNLKLKLVKSFNLDLKLAKSLNLSFKWIVNKSKTNLKHFNQTLLNKLIKIEFINISSAIKHHIYNKDLLQNYILVNNK